MAFLNENEWILLNEIAYNISFIYTVEEMQQEMLNRWLPFLIPYDAAIFARISTTEDGAYQFQTPAAFHLSQQAVGPVYPQRRGLSGIHVRSGRADKKSRNLPELLFAQPPDALSRTLDLLPGGASGPIASVS